MTAGDLGGALEAHLPICFGVSGPLGTPLSSQRHVSSLVAAATDMGISMFDTAPAYGAGVAERRLGHALKEYPDAFVMTKAGVTSRGIKTRVRDFSADAIRRSVEDSLRRLARDRIDLVWLHGPAASELNDDLCQALDDLKRSGKVRFIGAADRGLQAEKLMAAYPFDALMLPLNRLPKRAGLPLFAIEILSAARLSEAPLSGRGAFWRFLKHSLGRSAASDTGELSIAEALSAAARSNADVLCTTTTQARHLCETVNTIKPLLESRAAAR